MAANASGKSVVIPPGLRELLHELAVAIIRDPPSDLIEAAITFLTMKKNEATTQPSEDLSDDDSEPMPAPPRRTSRRAGVAAESYDPEKDDSSAVKTVHPKSDKQRQRLAHSTKDIILFRSLEAEQIQEVIDAMFEHRVKAGDIVIAQGDDGDNFYVIESGIYDIIVNINGKDQTVGKYDNKGSFGELALMYNTPRAATIKATTDGCLWAMSREEFRSIVLKKAFQKRLMFEQLLNEVPILQCLSPYERMNIADALKTQVFEDGQQILKQGDEGNEMYFVENGKVRIAMKKGNEEQQLTVLEQGGYFGELALLTKHPRAASAYAVGRTKVAVLDVGSFERLLGPCKDLLQRNIDDYETKLKSIFGNIDVSELRG